MMSPRERLMRALGREKPDRLPVTVHQWQHYHLVRYMGGVDELEAMRAMGMDAAVQHWVRGEELPGGSSPQWRERERVVREDAEGQERLHEIHTPEGDLGYRTASDGATTWITEYLIQRDEDVELIRKYMPVPRLDPAPVVALHDRVGDAGILRGFVWGAQAGCWQHACCLMAPTDLILRTFDDPGRVHELLKILLEKKLSYIESMAGAPYDLVETGGGSASTTLISPSIHREFCLPYDRIMHDALHRLGFRTTYHTCGGTRGIEEMIVENGTDASETLAGRSIGGNSEPWELKERTGDRLALIGGMDQSNVLTRGSPERIREEVRTLFERVGGDGGYVLSCSDHFFDTPPENLRVYAEAARECVY